MKNTIIIRYTFLCLVVGLLQSCAINNNQITWGSFLNRTIEDSKVKPFEKVLIVVDFYQIPHAEHFLTGSYSKLKDRFNTISIPTELVIKNYKEASPDQKIVKTIEDFKPSHIIYTSHPMVDVDGYTKDDYIDMKVFDTRLQQDVWKGRIVSTNTYINSRNVQRSIFKALEDDKFFKVLK